MSIPFDELVAGASVRCTVVDGVQFLSVRDLIEAACKTNNNQAGEIWRRIPETLKIELQVSCLNFKFPGRGQSDQPVIQFQGAIKLIMMLPGENAKKARSKAADIITRYFAGDKTLLEEIKANAESTAPINELARASLKRKPELDHDVEIAERMLAMEERKLAMVRVGIENVALKNKVQDDFLKSFMDISTQLGGMEERDKVQFRALLSVSLSAQTRMIMPASDPCDVPNAPTSIQIVVGHMNFKNLTNTDYQQIGRITKNKYVAAYGKAPTKHREVGTNGKYFDVNDYYDSDSLMIQDAAREYMATVAPRIEFPRAARK
jgi:hypothetical protein